MGAWDNKAPDKTAKRTIKREEAGLGEEEEGEGVTGAVINTNCKHLIRQHLVALIHGGRTQLARARRGCENNRKSEMTIRKCRTP